MCQGCARSKVSGMPPTVPGSLENRKEAVMTVPIDKNRCTYLTEKGNRCRNTR